MILRALPNARIIVVRRHPLNSVLSNYKQIFPFIDRYFDYVYDLEGRPKNSLSLTGSLRIGRGFAGDRFMVLQYEELVAQPEGEDTGAIGVLRLAVG